MLLMVLVVLRWVSAGPAPYEVGCDNSAHRVSNPGHHRPHGPARFTLAHHRCGLHHDQDQPGPYGGLYGLVVVVVGGTVVVVVGYGLVVVVVDG